MMAWTQFLFTRRLFILVFMIILLLLFFNLSTFYLTFFNNNIDVKQPRKPLGGDERPLPRGLDIEGDPIKNLDKIKDLNLRVSELLRIRSSVLLELRNLERNRSKIIQEISDKNNELEKLKTDFGKKSSELDRLQLHIKQAVVAQKEAKDLVDSLIEPPLNLLPKNAQQTIFPYNQTIQRNSGREKYCRMHNCFDFSRCSLFSPFYVFIYDKSSNLVVGDPTKESSSLMQLIHQKLKANTHVTQDPKIACIYMLIIDEHFKHMNDSVSFQHYLDSLPYWGGDGHNNIILNLNSFDLHSKGVNIRKAILVQNVFSGQTFRHSYDIMIPDLQIIHNHSELFDEISSKLSPAKRKYFLSFLGRIPDQTNGGGDNSKQHKNRVDDNLDNPSWLVKKTMLNLISKHGVVNHNEFLFDFDCDEKTKRLCDNQTIISIESTFTMLIVRHGQQPQPQYSFDEDFSFRFFNALSTGAIPIVIADNHQTPLPFEDVIDWRKAVIRLPVARITELYVLLKTYPDADLIEMRKMGNHFYQKYFANLDKFLATLFAYFGTDRLQIPPPAAPSIRSTYYYNQPRYDLLLSGKNSSDSELLASAFLYRNNMQLADGEEYLGPIEPPVPSLSFRRNYSITLSQSYSMWNRIGQTPFYTFPSWPFDPVLPSESKFIGSSFGFRPINSGLGGTGKEFSEALGGNHIREQFTIVVLTYEREKVLLDVLSKLKNLPYLNKVIVVWNSPRPPSADLIWPDIGVDIVVIKSHRNSLNNRFLPYDDIKTDAILSIDDDTNLRHDEIIFAFRVWREARDRIVGFPARYHSWDHGHAWLYNSNYTCEYSMILTGAAFFHKYYTYLYTYSMPSSIKDKVDELMNCEDIAMNFLVSHLTRQPPIKTTSKWTFRCAACETGLSEDQTHFEKRHKCINHFFQIYGYMPLLYTQFRADSVLFKTRIPHDKQKCFKYI